MSCTSFWQDLSPVAGLEIYEFQDSSGLGPHSCPVGLCTICSQNSAALFHFMSHSAWPILLNFDFHSDIDSTHCKYNIHSCATAPPPPHTIYSRRENWGVILRSSCIYLFTFFLPTRKHRKIIQKLCMSVLAVFCGSPGPCQRNNLWRFDDKRMWFLLTLTCQQPVHLTLSFDVELEAENHPFSHPTLAIQSPAVRLIIGIQSETKLNKTSPWTLEICWWKLFRTPSG